MPGVLWCARRAMHEESAEQIKARRHLRILVICMAVGIVLPVIAFWVVHLRSGA